MRTSKQLSIDLQLNWTSRPGLAPVWLHTQRINDDAGTFAFFYAVAMIFTLGLGIVGCGSGSGITPLRPSSVRSLVLYDVDPRESPDYTVLLTNSTSHALKPAEVKLLFQNTKEESLHIWKGAFLGIAHCEDGAKYHLAISNFGGFVNVLDTGQTLKFIGASAVEYERIRHAVLRDVFIPERQRKNQAQGH